jgi:hypothetical protein
MNANELTFGIELETTIPIGLIPVGSHGNGYPVASLPGWKADRDPSIRAGAGHEACEFVSPVFRGAEGLKQLIKDVKEIKAWGAKVNASCGMHIHVGFDRSDRVTLTKLVALVANFEKAIYASTGTKARETGRWCGGVHRYGQPAAAIQHASVHRYHVLNLSSEKPTVEFRAFAGTLNTQKIVGAVRMCVALVERAHLAKRVTKWTAKTPVPTSPLHRDGDGQTALTRFFYQVGWTKGETSYTYGNLQAEGAPSIDSTKRAFMAMARKYDAR